MEKKVRYLMLLLCLFMLPLKVFALEGDMDNTQDGNNVVANENINNEIDTNLEDLKKIGDPNTVLLGENETDKLDGAEGEEPGEDDPEGEDPEGEESGGEEPWEDDPESNDPSVGEGEGEPTTTVTELTSITLTGVNTELVDTDPVTFSGSSGETDKYQLVREMWNYYDGNGGYTTSSDAAYNAELQEWGEYFETVIEGVTYDYEVTLQLQEGYSLPEDVTVNINGTTYDGFAGLYYESDSLYYVYVDLYAVGKCKDAVLIDSLAVENAILDANIDQTPLYGASTSTEHFTVYGELWEGYTEVQNEDGSTDYYYHVNTNLSDLPYDEETFQKFDANYTYTYIVVVAVEKGYRLTSTMDGGEEVFNITINGQTPDYMGGDYVFDDGNYYYYAAITDITPTEAETYEVTENADPVMELEELEDTTIGVDGDFSTFENAFVDGNLVEEDNYEVDEEGSTITFLQSFLQTLAQGVHDVVLRFTDGHIASTTLTINGPEETTPVTETTATTSGIGGEAVYTTYTSEVEEKVEEPEKEKKEEKEKEKEPEKEKEKSNIGLIIFLIILILLAIAIPITVYKKKQD